MMKSSLVPAIVGTALAIGITTTMDATGFTMFSALPLFALTGLLWYVQRLTRLEMGLTWGRGRYYLIALLHPVVILGFVALIAFVGGAVDTTEANWRTAGLNALVGGTIGILMVLITEEGFFRGWLWASLQRSGLSREKILVWSSVAFALWHVSVVTLETGFELPPAQIPIYLINVVVIGCIWGMMRMASRSVVVPAICHAVWNAIDYPLFGFGTAVGELGITRTSIYGPEVGVLGLTLNAIFAVALWRWVARKNVSAT